MDGTESLAKGLRPENISSSYHRSMGYLSEKAKSGLNALRTSPMKYLKKVAASALVLASLAGAPACVTPTATVQPRVSIPSQRYTPAKIETLKRNFASQPNKYSQAMGQYILWQMMQRSPEFAREFAQTPELNDGINVSEARAMQKILSYLPKNIPSDLFNQRTEDVLTKTVRIEWTSPRQADFSGHFRLTGTGDPNYTQIRNVVPIGFEAGDRINQQLLAQHGDLQWKSTVSPGDTDGMIVSLIYSKDGIARMYINGQDVKFSRSDLLKGPITYDKAKGFGGTLKISNTQGNISPELYAVREMVNAGSGDQRYSAALEAILWGVMDGRWSKKGESPFKDYKGLVEFVKPIWGDMKDPKYGWDKFDVVTGRLSTPELIDYYTQRIMKFIPYHSETGVASNTFAEREGNCNDIEAFQRFCLQRAGLEAEKVKVVNYAPGYRWHAITEFKVPGIKGFFIMDNGRDIPRGIQGPYKDYSETNYQLFVGQ